MPINPQANFCANIGCSCTNPGPQGPAGPAGPPGPQGPQGVPGSPAPHTFTLQRELHLPYHWQDAPPYAYVSLHLDPRVGVDPSFGWTVLDGQIWGDATDLSKVLVAVLGPQSQDGRGQYDLGYNWRSPIDYPSDGPPPPGIDVTVSLVLQRNTA